MSKTIGVSECFHIRIVKNAKSRNQNLKVNILNSSNNKNAMFSTEMQDK